MPRFIVSMMFAFYVLAAAFAQASTVWQIGIDDQSSMEFHAKPGPHVFYQAGKSDWRQDWPAEETVGSNYEIQFSLDQIPHGSFLLKISALTYLPRIPALQVQINGHTGTYYLHPQLSYYLGDQRSIFDPHYSSDRLAIEIPIRYLHKGQNSLILSCVDAQSPGPSGDQTSGLRYDALSLVNEPGQKQEKPAIQALVAPTIFYVQKGDSLVEVVDAFLRFARPAPAGSATLTAQGRSYTASIAAVKDFGEQRLRFEIPEWSGTVSGHLQVNAGIHELLDVSLTPARKWTIFVVPHTHVDIGYTDYQGKVAEAQARTLDEAAALVQKYPAFRFSTDGSWNVQQFLATRSAGRQAEIVKLAQEDKIGIPAQYVNLLTGYASSETLYRSLYYSKYLSRRYNLPFAYANTTDVPTYTGAYPSILASAGIKYWVAGGNNDRAPILSHEAWNEKSPFWWEGPDGKKVLFWYSRCYEQVMLMFGLPPQQAALYDALPIFLQAYSKPAYKPDVALIYGTQPENTDLVPETAAFATTWNQAYVYPKLQYATFPDFFNYLEAHYGKELPTYKGDMGPYWEDGIGADAYYAAEDRQNQSDALSAEIVSTVTHTVDHDVHPVKAELDDAWNNIMLFAEHTWTADNSVTQPASEEAVKQLAVKDNRAVQARFDVEDIANRAMSQLANEIHIPSKTLVVFNALSWRRDALVETDLEDNQQLVDLATQQSIPFEVLSNKEHFVHVRFLAKDLPPVGYKCFEIRTASAPAAAAIVKNPVIENKYYRITVDPMSGSVKSIFDKQLQRELVDTRSPYKFGQYLYVTGGDGETRMINPFKALPLGELTIHPATSGEYLGEQETSWGESIRLRSSDVNTPAIDLEILLYNSQKRIEFRYSVEKQYTTAKEGVYFAFPIAVSSPKFAYAIQQGWIDPARDLFKGASLEWFTVQKWMAADDSHLAVGIVPVDASLASFGDINRGEWPGEFHPKTSTIFSYAMNNYWHTNYPAGQGGVFTFRYVLTSADHLDPATLTRLGWESMELPELDHVINQDKVGDPERPLPADGTSFVQIDAPNVALITWKLAEDGNGTILRLQETEGQTTETTVSLPHMNIRSAILCNGVEDKLHNLEVAGNRIQLTLRPYEIVTVRVVGDARLE